MSRSIRFGVRAVACLVLILIAFRIAAFVQLFYEHSGVALTQQQVVQDYEDALKDVHKRPTIPKIIHQIFHNWTDPSNVALPDDWAEARQTCIDLNEDWKSYLWTEKASREFIAEEYPWFLSTYDNFKYPIQKIDALRYFLLRHFGGIYIDLDDACMASLEPLRYYPAWVADGARGALSNNILGGEPNHPYWVLMSDSIMSYAWNYPLPYLTISYATGQWYETEIWEKYHRRLPKDQPVLTRIIMDSRPGAPARVFFKHTRGGTWDNWDNVMFKWIGDHLAITFLVVVGFVGSVVGALLGIVRLAKQHLRSRKGYVPLQERLAK